MLEPYHKSDHGKIYHGDCLKILPKINEADLLITDIPFNVNLKYAIYNDNLSNLEYQTLCYQWFLAFRGAAKSYIVKVPTKNIQIVLKCFADVLDYKWTFIQYSPNATTHGYFNLSLYTQYLVGGDLPKKPKKDVIVNTHNRLKTSHPAEMPVAPITQILELFSKSDSFIIDPLLGSGTTGEACERLSRRWIGIEISEEYCEMAKRRLLNENKQLKLFNTHSGLSSEDTSDRLVSGKPVQKTF